ncbi:hypothetical protein RirG_164530 [Rhizophagus irregularis DAOM 197198w]|uniref:Uncharacterized protein n=1 Tax=Rhizophagus irregularis (strain DAOM 197198w) TaxID=1432141 RepID=A0A015J5Z9_RHIIW|nr:hypothetical protein RirG_164530 [Rhizophagus irregularis DAOM 197198w]
MDFFLQLPKEKMDILLIQFMHFNIMINLKSLNIIVIAVNSTQITSAFVL